MHDFDLEKRLYYEDLKLASTDKRTVSHIIDDLILLMLLFLIISDTISNSSNIESKILFINSLVIKFMIIKFLYHLIFTALYGASIGKMLLKIKIVDQQGFHTPLVIQSATRSFVRLFSESIFYLGFLWAIFDQDKQGWHDKIARTIVVNVK